MPRPGAPHSKAILYEPAAGFFGPFFRALPAASQCIFVSTLGVLFTLGVVCTRGVLCTPGLVWHALYLRPRAPAWHGVHRVHTTPRVRSTCVREHRRGMDLVRLECIARLECSTCVREHRRGMDLVRLECIARLECSTCVREHRRGMDTVPVPKPRHQALHLRCAQRQCQQTICLPLYASVCRRL